MSDKPGGYVGQAVLELSLIIEDAPRQTFENEGEYFFTVPTES